MPIFFCLGLPSWYLSFLSVLLVALLFALVYAALVVPRRSFFIATYCLPPMILPTQARHTYRKVALKSLSDGIVYRLASELPTYHLHQA